MQQLWWRLLVKFSNSHCESVLMALHLSSSQCSVWNVAPTPANMTIVFALVQVIFFDKQDPFVCQLESAFLLLKSS